MSFLPTATSDPSHQTSFELGYVTSTRYYPLKNENTIVSETTCLPGYLYEREAVASWRV